ncbi:MAG: phospholipid-binding protein MlaC [Gemmatimonadales bacterium]
MQPTGDCVLFQETRRPAERTRFAAVAWFTVLLFCAAPIQGGELAAARPSNTTEDPRDFVKGLTESVVLTMGREGSEIHRNPLRIYEIVDEVISPHIDTDRFSSLVLGKHWAAASPAQRRQFQSAITDQIVQTLVKGISQFIVAVDPKSTKVRYLASRPNGSPRDVTVRSRIGGAGARSIRVDYRLHQVDGRWRFYDLVIAGASLVLTYRRDYVVEVERTGLDRLIERVSVDTPGAYRGHRSVGWNPTAGS